MPAHSFANVHYIRSIKIEIAFGVILLTPVGLSPKRRHGFGLNFRVCACVCVCNHISDIYGPILFVLCTQTTNDGVHMHVILFRDAIKDGRLAAFLVVKKTPR